MELKAYQERVLKETRDFLEALAQQQRSGNLRHAASDAWEASGRRRYVERRAGNNADLPTFCIKVPTGGGKTLLATQIVGLAYRTILTARNGAGLVLWVVPSDQIYRDTLRALRDRSHFYRESLEFAVSRKIEVWEKQDIARLTPAQLAECLNILIVKLQGTNKQDRESLKFFRDSGGNIVQHFPPEDDPEGHRRLKERIPNLEMLEEDAQSGLYLAKTSIGNLVRLCQPVVILDEGHKATSALAQATIANFNSCLVVELSATPAKEANILSRVSGLELLNEEMIKLPINVSNMRHASWQNVLTQAKEQREKLAALAIRYYQDGHRLIRPIVLVQVERTGKDQRDGSHIHAEDAREYLVQRLGVPDTSVKVKTSETDGLEGIDLLSEDCPVEWIITKSALQEGWDCPFAYILVSLSNTGSLTAMTQLVGRVLRQPFVQKTPYTELNESYVYCLRDRSGEVLNEIRGALLKEGYEGDVSSVVDRSSEDSAGPQTREASLLPRYTALYGRPFVGRIFLPRFCVQTPDGPERLDYFRHLLSAVDVRRFAFEKAADWNFAAEIASAKEQFARVKLGEPVLPEWDIVDVDRTSLDSPEETRAWLTANLGMEWFSAKQLRYIVNAVCERLTGVGENLALVRFRLLELIRGLIEEQTDLQTEGEFVRLHERGNLLFYLACKECAFEIPPKVVRRRNKPLLRDDYTGLQRNLFDFQEDEVNEYERKVALYLDNHPEVLWWYRSVAAPGEFDIQGWRRHRIRPDFVVQQPPDGNPTPTVLVVESKGAHLKGNLDTDYKRKVADYFTRVGQQVSWQEFTWQELGEGFDQECFRFEVLDEGEYPGESWREKLNDMLGV